MFREKMQQAINEKRFVKLTFNAIEKGVVTRKCVPYDIGPLNRSKNKRDRFHFCDLDSPDGAYTLSILPEQILSLELTNKRFEPVQYISWTTNWHYPRDWGIYL